MKDKYVVTDELIYEINKITEQHNIHNSMLDVAVSPSQYLDGIVISVVRRIATWKPQFSVLTVRWPAKWWQHFKQDHFPRWALNYWPVLYQTEVYQAVAYLPDVPVPHPTTRVWYDFQKLVDGQ